MTTQEIATRYRALANQRKFIEIQDTFYHQDVVCQEPEKAAAKGLAVFTHGLDAIKAKGVARRAAMEAMHHYDCSEPLVAGEFFSVVLKSEITFKGQPRIALEEIGIFHVEEGKITMERFFY